MHRRTHPYQISRMTRCARSLRRRSTWPERMLWSRLRERRLCRFKWRRQVPMGPYVADFFCESARMVVELDGMSHVHSGEADARRSKYLQSLGLRVIRVTNDDVLQNIDAVLEFIARAALTPSPSPEGRGEQDHLAPWRAFPSPPGRGSG